MTEEASVVEPACCSTVEQVWGVDSYTARTYLGLKRLELLLLLLLVVLYLLRSLRARIL